jgi:hypothetical protein
LNSDDLDGNISSIDKQHLKIIDGCVGACHYKQRHTDLHEVAILASHYGYPAVEVEKVGAQG